MRKTIPTFEELQERRLDILTAVTTAKTPYLKDFLGRRLTSVHRDLFTLTKNPIYRWKKNNQ